MTVAQNQAQSMLRGLFSPHELRRLATSLGVAEHMPGDTASHARHAEAFLNLVSQRELVEELITLIARERPSQDCSELRAVFKVIFEQRRLRRPISNLGSTRRDLLLLGLVISSVAIASYFLWDNRPVINQEACTVKCNNCRDVQRAWIVLETGQTYHMEIAGNTFIFHCLPREINVSIVIEVTKDGSPMFRATPYLTLTQLRGKVSLDQFIEQLPSDFRPHEAEELWLAISARTWKKKTVHSKDCDWYTELEICRSLCEEGNSDACLLLGLRHDWGDGVSEDLREATTKYRQACTLKNATGCYYLGIQYDYGYGVPEDDEEANKLYQEACLRGTQAACTSYGYQLAHGNGVEEADDAVANEFYNKACGPNGDAAGCALLGFQYDYGRGVEQDHKKANLMYRQACDGLDGLGCVRLAQNLQNGIGVAKPEHEEARMFFELACANGISDACERTTKVSESSGCSPS